MNAARLTFQTVEFSVIDHHGQTWLTMRDITAALYSGTEGGDTSVTPGAEGGGQSDAPSTGWGSRSVTPAAEASIRRVFARHAHEFTADMTALVKVLDPEPRSGVPAQRRAVRIFSLRGAYLLGMLARTPKAEAFRRWVLDVLEGVTNAPATLYARLIEAQRKEAESFADASRHAQALRQRQQIKPKLNDEIDKASAALQLALPLEGGAA